MTTPIDLTPEQQKAFASIINLRKLYAETGCQTNKTQTAILRSLNAADLTAVANALAQQ